MTVYTVTSSELQAAWRNVHPALWQGFYDRLEQQISAKAAALNEAVSFHEYNHSTPVGGSSLLVECSDAMAVVISAMPEVHMLAPEKLLPTVLRSIKQAGPQP